MDTVLVKDDYLSKRTNTRIFFEEEISEREYDERKTKQRKLMYALNMRAKEERDRYNDEHRNGYCPECHMLIPMNGICECGYEVQR